MLKNLIIFAFCIIAIKASGEFNVLKCPESLSFKGNDKMDSEYVGEVLSAAMGKWVDDGVSNWSGLYMNNIFNLPNKCVVFLVKAIDHLNFNSKVKSYKMMGSSSEDSLNAASSYWESSGIPTIVLDTNQFSESMMMIDDAPSQIAPIKSTNNLKPDLHSEDKDFLTKIAYIKQLVNKFLTSNKSDELLIVLINLEPIAKAHGEKSLAMVDAQKIVTSVMEESGDLADKNSLVIALAEKAESNRAKREAVNGEDAKSLNLATYYNEDYPVIFNIILWFMVVLGFSLLAICYAIGSMDPGRDSIIYRMTSTRMKKDN